MASAVVTYEPFQGNYENGGPAIDFEKWVVFKLPDTLFHGGAFPHQARKKAASFYALFQTLFNGPA